MTLSAIEAGSDSASLSGGVLTTGTINATEDGSDTCVFSNIVVHNILLETTTIYLSEQVDIIVSSTNISEVLLDTEPVSQFIYENIIDSVLLDKEPQTVILEED